MGIEEARPEQEPLPALGVAVQQVARALGDPGAVVERLRDLPGSPLAVIGAGGRAEVVAPVAQSLLLHPERVVLADVRFVGVIAGQLDVLEAVERALEAAPERQVLQRRIRFQRWELRASGQRLEVRLAHQRRAHAGRLQVLADGVLRFEQLGAQRVGAVLARVLAGDDRGAGRRTGGIGTIGAGEQRSLRRQPVEAGGPDLRVETAQGVPVLLVGSDQEDVACGTRHGAHHTREDR